MNKKVKRITPDPMFRCAVYTCSDSTLARRTHSEVQERICRQAISSLGMVVEEQFVINDVRRLTSSPREGLADLLAAAKQNPRPFTFISWIIGRGRMVQPRVPRVHCIV